MIEIFEGRIGGGKTFYAVQRMLKYMASGGCVSTNIELNWPKVEAYVLKKYSWKLFKEQFIYLPEEQINLFHRFTPAGSADMPSLVVVDEAHIWLNARDWGKQSRELLTFLTQSRKCFTDIIFISQSALNVDKQILRLVQYIWKFRDMKKWRIAGVGVSYPLDQFLRIQYDQDGTTILDRALEFKEKAVYELYYSYKLLRTFPRLEGHVTKFDGKIKKKYGVWMKIIIVIVLCAVGMCVWTYSKFQKNTGTIWKKTPIAELGKTEKTSVGIVKKVSFVGKVKSDLIQYDYFRGIIEDERGRVVIGDKETYIAGGICDLGKVVQVKNDLIVVAGFDGRPYIIRKKRAEQFGVVAASRNENQSLSRDNERPAGAGATIASGVRSFDIFGGKKTVENN